YPFVGSAEKIYKLDRDKGLVALHSRSALQYHTSSHIFTVNTELQVQARSDQNSRLIAADRSGRSALLVGHAVRTRFTLTLERTDRLRSTAQLPLNNSHPVYYPHYYRQPFNGRVAADQAWLAKLTKEVIPAYRNINENRT
ncbi:hypothetical protein EVAR_58445_1, partial [Eumeta japonica]